MSEDGKARYDLTFKDVVEILSLVELSAHCSELNVTVGEVALSLTRDVGQGPAIQPAPASARPAAQAPVQAPSPAQAAAPAPQTGPGIVAAPMAGIFYRSPSPGEPPFVEAGTRVQAGDTVGLIEVMKLFTPITADGPGMVTEFFAEDGKTVEKAQALLRIVSDETDRESGEPE